MTSFTNKYDFVVPRSHK